MVTTLAAGIAGERAPQPVRAPVSGASLSPRFPCRRLRSVCDVREAVKHWSLRSVQVKLIKMGGRLVRHSRRLIFQLSEVSVPRRLFQGVLDRIGRLSPAPS